MMNKLNELKTVKYAKTDNAKGVKVEQKQARAIKSGLVTSAIEALTENGYTVKYDAKNTPCIVMPNGLIIGFEFTVKSLDIELSDSPKTKEKGE